MLGLGERALDQIELLVLGAAHECSVCHIGDNLTELLDRLRRSVGQEFTALVMCACHCIDNSDQGQLYMWHFVQMLQRLYCDSVPIDLVESLGEGIESGDEDAGQQRDKADQSADLPLGTADQADDSERDAGSDADGGASEKGFP